MLNFTFSCFLLLLGSLTQFAAAAENDCYMTPLRLGRVAIPHLSPVELAFLSFVREGNLYKVNEFLESNWPIDADLFARALILASDQNKHFIVQALLRKNFVGVDVVQDALLVAARKNSGEVVAEILKSGAYDTADLKTTFTTALTCNSVSVVKAFLQFPKFRYPDTEKSRAIIFCEAKKFDAMEKLLRIPREQLLAAADDGNCVLF